MTASRSPPADVKCTWDMIAGNAPEKFRVNPRKSWYRNLDAVTVDNDHQVTFSLKRPQPSFIALLASGWSPVYPCHVSPAQMRRAPIGTGPFKFVEFKPNESIKIVRNPDYWKKDRPYLDAIEYTFMANPSTAILAFAAGNFDRFAQGILSLPLMKQLKEQAPNAVCEVVSWNIPRQLLVNPSSRLSTTSNCAAPSISRSTARRSSTSSATGKARSAAR